MAGRASGRGSENHTRPRIRHAGALSLTAVQDLERSMERMKDLENVSPQKVAPKARKMIQTAAPRSSFLAILARSRTNGIGRFCPVSAALYPSFQLGQLRKLARQSLSFLLSFGLVEARGKQQWRSRG